MPDQHPHLSPLPFYGQGTHLHHIRDPSGIICEPHHHLYYELDYVLNGRGVFAVGARKVEVKPGDLVYLARGVYHWRMSYADNSLELCNLTLADRDMQRFFDAHPAAEEVEWPWWRHWKKSELTDAASQALLDKMVRNMRRRTGRLPTVTVASMVPGIIELLSRDRPGGIAAGPELRTLARRIRHEPQLTLRLDTEAARLDVSRWWLSRIFKRRFALTLWEYRDYTRVEHAIRRLLTSDISVRKLGHELGFAGTAQFIATFKRLAGKTPARFRRRYKDVNNFEKP